MDDILITSFPQQMVPDNYINLLGQENLEIACQAIEKAARDRAVLDFDENFGNHSEVRRMHREVSGHPFGHRSLVWYLKRHFSATTWSAVLGSLGSTHPLHSGST